MVTKTTGGKELKIRDSLRNHQEIHDGTSLQCVEIKMVIVSNQARKEMGDTSNLIND